jgi:ubiquinone/menaquinone biosynthesis C-methylase UbiE
LGDEAKSSLRRVASKVIRKYRWLPAVATLASALGLLIALVIHLETFGVLAAAVVLAFTSYVLGYSERALKQPLWPPLTHLRRRSYAEVWDSLAASRKEASVAAAGQEKEAELRRSAAECIRNLLELALVGTEDEVLEIGCGVGRIGLELAPHCHTWTGADISANMLAHASDRLRGVDNVRLLQLHDIGLAELSSGSFHVVYVTNMLLHLDEIDRWRYVQETFRVLRPGGRIFVDNFDLASDAGWAMFANDAKRFQDLERPPYMPRFSTAEELMAYAVRAGFERVQSHPRPPLVIVTGIKPLVDSRRPLGATADVESLKVETGCADRRPARTSGFLKAFRFRRH